jgi:hypothetical protein
MFRSSAKTVLLLLVDNLHLLSLEFHQLISRLIPGEEAPRRALWAESRIARPARELEELSLRPAQSVSVCTSLVVAAADAVAVVADMADGEDDRLDLSLP